MTWKPLLTGFFGTIAALILALLTLTLYQDHVIVRTLLQIEQQRAQAAQSAPKTP